jgi:CPA2 family monovalent cation:H+ antiporter-2
MEELQLSVPYLREIVVFLAAAGLVVPALSRLRINPVLGYLAIGVLIGPFGLGLMANEVTWLRHVLIADTEGVQALASLGVVFLLFTIGLELSLDRLWAMRRLVFGLGSAQYALTALAIGAIAWALGNGPQASIVLGACLAFSSTAIVMQLLIDRRELGAPLGRSAFAVLLLQDLAVVPILLLLGVFGGEATARGVGVEVLIALGTAAGAVLAIVVVGRLVLRPLFRLVGSTRSRELFLAVTLLVVIGTATATAAAGLSMALGAFLAGLLLAETEYRHEIDVDLEPFKGLLLGLFFMTVGMGVDFRAIAHDVPLLIAAVLGLLLVKTAILVPLGLAFRLPRHVAVETGLLLGQGGEFAFVVVGLAVGLAIVPREIGQFMLIMVGLSMVATPLVAVGARRLAKLVERHDAARSQGGVAEEFAGLEGHIVLGGYGRVGAILGDILDEQRVPAVAVDLNPPRATAWRSGGHRVYFGDATRTEILRRVGTERAQALVLTMDDPAAAERGIKAARALWPTLPIYARARDIAHARRLMELGATWAVPENFEASLQLGCAVLEGLGVPEEVADRLAAARRDAALPQNGGTLGPEGQTGNDSG